MAGEDGWDYADAFKLLGSLPANFDANVASAKWGERKEALEALKMLLDKNPRLDAGEHYHDLLGQIAKVIAKDANVMVVTAAAHCVAGLASGLRKHFSVHVPTITPVLLEKFKERRVACASAVAGAVDAIFKWNSMETVLDDVTKALEHKSPGPKVQTALVLARLFPGMSSASLPKKTYKPLADILVKMMKEADAEIRDAAAAALGASMVALGDKPLAAIAPELVQDAQKWKKITDAKEKAVALKEDKPEAAAAPKAPVASSGPPATSSGPPVASAAASTAPEASVAPVGPPEMVEVEEEIEVEEEGDADPWEYADAFKLISNLPLNFETNVAAAKWSERKEALESLKTLLDKNPRLDTSEHYHDLVGQLTKMAGKDANIMVAVAAAQCVAGVASGLRKKFSVHVPSATPLLLEKFKERKVNCTTAVASAVDAVFKWNSMEPVLDDFAKALEHKSPGPKIQTALLLSRIFPFMDSGTLPKKIFKPLADILIKMMKEADAEIRDAAAAALGASMVALGDKPLAAIAPELVQDAQKWKKITDAKEKAVVLQQTRGKKLVKKTVKRMVAVGGGGGATAVAVAGASTSSGDGMMEIEEEIEIPAEAEADPWEFASDFKLLSSMPLNFETNVVAAKWSERKEALEALKAILDKNSKLDPSEHYHELVGQMQTIIGKDANVMVVGAAAHCVAGIASGLRKKFSVHVTSITPVLLEKFKEKKPVCAGALVAAVDAIFKWNALEPVLEDVAKALEHKTPAVKIQTALLLSRIFPFMDSGTLPKKIFKPLADNLVKMMKEADADTRDAAAAALGASMVALGEKPLAAIAPELVKDAQKWKKVTDGQEKGAELKKTQGVKMIKKIVKRRVPIEGTKAAAPSAGAKKDVVSKKPPAPVQKSRDPSPEEKAGASGPARKGAKTPSKAAPPKASGAEDAGCLIHVPEGKKARALEEKQMKILKWAFVAPEAEHLEQLKTALGAVAKAALHAQLFATDFKLHLKALEALTACISTAPDAVLSSSDLLIKWCSLRFFDTNPTVLARTLAFLSDLLGLMQDSDYRMSDTEAGALLPYVLLKAGDGKENVRNGVKGILDQSVILYAPSKVFPLVLESTKVKNSKQKAVCLDYLAGLVEENGIAVAGPASQGSVKTMATAIGDRDAAVRNAALNCMLAVHMHIGERVFKQVAHLGHKETAMLEERIKRSAHKGPRIAAAPATPGRAGVSGGARNRSATPTSRSATPMRGSRSMQQMDKPQLNGDGMANGHSDENIAPSRPRIPDDGYFPRLPDGEIDYAKMGFNWLPASAFRTEMPPESDWYRAFEEDARDPFVYPTLKGCYGMRERRGSNQSLVSVGSNSTIMDTSAALDQTISQITSKSLGTAITSIGQLDEVLHDTEGRAALVQGKVDQVLMAVFFQLRMAANTHIPDPESDKAQIIELYRAVGALLISLIKLPYLMREATGSVLKDLLMQLLSTLLNERLDAIDKEKHVSKSVNWLVVRLVEGAERTACLVAILQLLRETLLSQTASPKFTDLCLKCLWRKCRELQSPDADTVRNLVAAPILEEADRFFNDFPGAFWKERDDKPLKTVKTILSYLAKALGPAILDETGGLGPDAPVTLYLRRILKDAPKEGSGSKLGATGMSESVTLSASTTAKQPLSEANNNSEGSSKSSYQRSLNDIFKAIADKKTSKDGIRALYDFLEENPRADIEPFMQKSTDFFQKYITRGLEQVGKERRRTHDVVPIDSTTVRGQESRAALSRLNDVRRSFGFEPVAAVAAAPLAAEALPKVRGVKKASAVMCAGGVGSSATFTRPPKPKPKISPEEMDTIKERLARIKRGEV